jgi:hypothetical protein
MSLTAVVMLEGDGDASSAAQHPAVMAIVKAARQAIVK